MRGFRRHAWRLGALLLPAMLTGCGPDRPAVQQAGGSQPPPPSAAPADAPLIAGPNSASPSNTSSRALPDPLLSGAGAGRSSDPLIKHDPLQGPVMPTQHSHWLRGRLRQAHVTVRLNNMRLGTYYGVLDQDITMRLHEGINSVTFVYQPGASGSSATLELLESEHHPPIAPLVTFHSPPPTDDGLLTPVTKTFSFVAR